MPFPDHEATNAHGVPMFQGNVILRLAHAYIRLSPGPPESYSDVILRLAEAE